MYATQPSSNRNNPAVPTAQEVQKLQADDNAVAVIFAGGEGSRLWPVSTQETPKQFNFTLSAKTWFLETYERAAQLFDPDRIVVVVTQEVRDLLAPLVDLAEKNIVVQPKNADTAAAMVYTALHLEIFFPESVAVLLYTDHNIPNSHRYLESLRQAISIAHQSEHILCIGTRPHKANTQYGHIKLGQPTHQKQVYQVQEFVEKPNEEQATEYWKSGQYLWNTGAYVWKTSVLLEKLQKLEPRWYRSLVTLRASYKNPGYQEQVEAWFNSIEKQPFEALIMNYTESLRVFEADYTWYDVGNWESFAETFPKDADGNAALVLNQHQKARFVNSQNCFALAYENVSVVGLSDVFVIHAHGELFVCHRSYLSQLKDLIQMFEQNSEFTIDNFSMSQRETSTKRLVEFDHRKLQRQIESLQQQQQQKKPLQKDSSSDSQ